MAARSVKKHMPGTPVALFTDMADHPLVRLGSFDEVLNIRIEHRFASKWATGKLPRIVALSRSPFAKTLHLDCDTRVTDASAGQIFTLLDAHDIALVECQPGESFSRTKYAGRMFNGGMVAFKNCAATRTLFEHWHDLTLSHHRMGNATPMTPPPPYLAHITNTNTLRRLLKMDQVSLAQYLSPDVNVLNLKVLALDDTWNARNPARLLDDGLTVKINHDPENRSRSWEILACEAESIAKDGDNELANIILEVVDQHLSAQLHQTHVQSPA